MHDVKIVEVGPRDGLQNEQTTLSPIVRSEFVHRLAATGISVIEVGSFVSPKAIPQMADTATVLQLCQDLSCDLPVLVPNQKGLEQAQEAKCKTIAIFAACTDSFSLKNIRCTIDSSLLRFEPIIQSAKALGMEVRGYLSCVLGCPYEGNVSINTVCRLTEKLLDFGCDEISLGDTIGVGTANKVQELLSAIAGHVPLAKLAVHFHNTYGQALANVYAALEKDIRIIDASCAGLGGCPYAKGASGNIATEEVVYLLQGMGLSTGINLSQLIQTGHWICNTLGIETRSLVARAYQE